MDRPSKEHQDKTKKAFTFWL